MYVYRRLNFFLTFASRLVVAKIILQDVVACHSRAIKYKRDCNCKNEIVQIPQNYKIAKFAHTQKFTELRYNLQYVQIYTAI